MCSKGVPAFPVNNTYISNMLPWNMRYHDGFCRCASVFFRVQLVTAMDPAGAEDDALVEEAWAFQALK